MKKNFSTNFKIIIALSVCNATYNVDAAIFQHSPLKIMKSEDCGPFLPKPSRQEAADMQKYYPLTRYRKFPVQLRPMFQRADSEHDICRGLPDANAKQDIVLMQRCNRAHRAYFLLEKKGWCWGGSDISAEQRWIKCASGPKNRSPDLQYDGDPFTKRDLRRALRKLHPLGALPVTCPI